jgi:flagellar biosynthetic protein FlhB
VAVLLSAGALDAPATYALGCHLVYRLAVRLGLVLLVLALLDYAYQRWNWWRHLKMTKQEIKDELRNMEGDPLIRQRRRRAQLQLAIQRISAAVPQSDVVVTNPTEFAVALAYDEQTMAAPRVTAKGQDFLALRIRQLAQQHGVPIVQRPPLARALYAAVEVGQEVPPMFYRAIAEVLAYVYQLSGRAVAARA